MTTHTHEETAMSDNAKPKSALEIMLGDCEPWPSPSGLFVGPPTPMQDMARRWLAEVVELANVKPLVGADANPIRCPDSSVPARSAETARPETACEPIECPSLRSDTELRPTKILQYGFGEAGRPVFDPRLAVE